MRVHFAIAVALAACSKRNESAPIVAESPPKPAIVASASASSTAVAKLPKADPKLLTPSEAARAACAKLEVESAKALATARAKDPDLVVAIPDAIGTCLPYANGAWGLVLQSAVDAPGEHYGGSEATGGVSARWALVHVDLAGVRASIAPRYKDLDEPFDVAPDGVDNLVAGDLHHYTLEATLFDGDGDGVAEVFVHETLSLYEGQTGTRGAVFTAMGSKIVRPAGAEGADVERIEDVDHDGLADLVTYAGEKKVFGLDEETVEAVGVARLLHADPAKERYVVDDAVALSFVRAGCPKAPSEYVTKAVDASTFSKASCARAWGISEADVAKAIAAEIAPDPIPAALAEWIKRPPPLRLTSL